MSYNSPRVQSDPIKPGKAFLWTILSLVIIVLVVGLFIGGCAGLKAFGRSQARADAQNRVSITRIQIQNQEQQAKVVQAQNGIVKQQAEQRYLEAVGVRRAQDEISRTLTPYYLQYEAIKAEEQVATSGQNNTVVYVPSGNMGVPLVQQATGPTSTLTKNPPSGG